MADDYPRTNLQYGYLGVGIHRVGNAPGDAQVSQKVLTKVLLGPYLFHLLRLFACKDSQNS